MPNRHLWHLQNLFINHQLRGHDGCVPGTRIHCKHHQFHLAGCSNGGNSAFHLALRYPKSLASLSVVPGSAPADSNLAKLQGIVVRQFVGADDEGWRRAAEAIHDRLLAIGVQADLTVVPDEGHFIQSLIGDSLMKKIDDRHTRPARPTP